MDSRDKEIKHLKALIRAKQSIIDQLRDYIREMLRDAKK